MLVEYLNYVVLVLVLVIMGVAGIELICSAIFLIKDKEYRLIHNFFISIIVIYVCYIWASNIPMPV